MAKARVRKRPAASEAPADRRLARPFVWAPLVIILAGLAAYANSLAGPILFDDEQALVRNASIRDLASAWSPPLQNPLSGRPLVNASFAVNYALGGFGVRGYHVVNIAVHILAALALLGVLKRTLGRDRDGWLALFCALAWTVHPLNTEAVSYITQRTELLMGLFYFCSLYAAIRALESSRPLQWEIAAGVAALAGVASKETAVTIPLVLLLWDRAFAFPSFRDAWTARRRLYGIAAACWLLFAFQARQTPFFTPTGFQDQVSRLTYLLNQGPMIARYLGLALWPQGLVFDYGVVPPITFGQALPGVALIAALLVVSVIALIRRPAVGFWGAWFFITLAPASSIIPIPTEVGAERRMYLPLVAVIVVVAMLAAMLLRRIPVDLLRARAAWVLGAAVVLGLTSATVARNADYRDGLTMWQTVLDRYPHSRAHEHISMYLRDAGRVDDAIAHLRIAAPTSPNSRHALASALLGRGDVKGSIAEFREFFRQSPADPELASAHREFGVALVRDGDRDGAVAEYRELLKLQPRDLDARHQLLVLLLDQKKFAEAEAEGQALVAQNPNDADGHNFLGVAIASQSGERLAEAARHFAEAVRLDPSSQDAQNNLRQANLALGPPVAPR